MRPDDAVAHQLVGARIHREAGSVVDFHVEMGDPLYDVLSPTQIRVKLGDGGYSTYVKCTTETKPVLRYK